MDQGCSETSHGLFTYLFIITISLVLCQKSDACPPPASLLPIPGSMLFFLIPEIKMNAEKMPFLHHWWHKNKSVKGTAEYLKRSFPELICELKNRWERMWIVENSALKGTMEQCEYESRLKIKVAEIINKRVYYFIILM